MTRLTRHKQSTHVSGTHRVLCHLMDAAIATSLRKPPNTHLELLQVFKNMTLQNTCGNSTIRFTSDVQCSQPAELPSRVSYKSYEYRSYAVYTYICNTYMYAYILLFTDCEYLSFCITIMYSRIHTNYLIWPRYAVNLLRQVR